MKLPHPRKKSYLDGTYEICAHCDKINKKFCVREDDVALCIKDYQSTKWYPKVTFEVGKSYEIHEVECDNTGQHAVYVKHESDGRPHWFILKYHYQISGNGYKISNDEPAFSEYFEIVRISRIKKLQKLRQL